MSTVLSWILDACRNLWYSLVGLIGGWSGLLILAYGLTIFFTVIVVIVDKREPSKATLWVVVLILLPIVGFVLYIFFGRNFRRRRIFRRKEPMDLSEFEESIARNIVDLRSSDLPEELERNRHIARLIMNNNFSPVLGGNGVSVYHSGEMAFKALLEDISQATRYIHLEYYIFRADEIGRRIGNILIERAQAGIDVRIIYDSVGSFGLSRRFVRQLKRAGIRILPFQEITFPFLASRLNYRNHRKILVVDGVIAHMGGMNVADKYIHGDPKVGRWHDTQVRIQGPAVAALHEVFLADWSFVSRTPEPENHFQTEFTSLPGQTPIQVAASGPDSDWASIMQAFFLAISRARRYIYLCTPYFVPNESILTALRTAALSGVDVKVLLPNRSDSRFVQWATRSYIQSLLEAGIKVYQFNGGFNHSKIMMVDGELATVGSANMDIRSFEDNFEVVAFIYDSTVTGILESEFLRDALASTQLNLESWLARPFHIRFKDAFARLFSPLF